MSAATRTHGVGTIEGIADGVPVPVRESSIASRATATFSLSLDPHVLPATVKAIVVSKSGAYKLRLANDVDADYVTPYLLQGVVYRFAVAKIWATGSVADSEITTFAS